MSSASEIYSITACIEKAEKLMNLKKDWKSNNKEQSRFLNNFLKDCKGSKISEIEVEVSEDANKINNFLEKKGFSIRLQPFSPNTLGFASILDLIVEWFNIGEIVKIKAKNEKIYDGVRIKKEGVSFFKSKVKGELYTVARLSTKSGDMVFITIPKSIVEGLDLMEMAENISNKKLFSSSAYDASYDGIRFPMVDLDITNDLSWLRGMSNTSGKMPYEITQAVQQIKIKMNEKGARFKSATAMSMILMAVRVPPKEDLIIREPFLLWVERNGLKKPLMAAYITEESWKNPGQL